MQNSIYHYGIKGMKWGVRRTPAQLGHQLVSTQKKKSPEDYYRLKTDPNSKIGKILDRINNPPVLEERVEYKPSKYAKYATKPKQKVSEMSDQELQQKINRMQKEKQYKDMTKSPYMKAGERIVQGVIVAAGTELAKEYMKKHLRKGLEAVVKTASK